jgi:zinc-ribbon domain
MYCPRCGQQQISDEMKFCSRCGLPLSGLTDWLHVNGLPAGREQEAQVALRSPRRKGIRRGAKVMFFGGALFPIFLLLSLGIDEPGPLVVPIITFFIGLTITLYSKLFVEDFPLLQGQQPQRFVSGATAAGQALPPASSTPVYSNFAGQQVRTNELAQPPSVTEQTTRLLDQD